MKRSALFAVAAVVFATACQDAVTSPQLSTDLAYAITGNPPPPPIDTGARGQFFPAFLREDPAPRFLQPRYSIVQSDGQQQRRTVFGLPQANAQTVVIDAFNFFLPVKYTLSTDGTDGELQFKGIKDSKAVLKQCKVTMVDGVFTGKGLLTIQTTEGLLVIDCSSIEQFPDSYFERCGTGPTERCFHVVFADATLDGEPGSVEAITSCDPEEASNEENSCPDFPNID